MLQRTVAFTSSKKMGKQRRGAHGATTSPPAIGGVAATVAKSFAQPEPVTEADVIFAAFDSEMAAATATIARLTRDDPGTVLARIIDRTIVAPTVLMKLCRDGIISFFAIVHVLLRDHWAGMQAQLLGPAGAPYLKVLGFLQQTICPRQLPSVALDPVPNLDQLYMLTALEGVRSVHRRLPDDYLQKADFIQLRESRWIVDLLGLFLFRLPAADATLQLMNSLLVAWSNCRETGARHIASRMEVQLIGAWRRAIQQVFTGQAPTDSSNVVTRAYAMSGPGVREAVFDFYTNADAVDTADSSVDAVATLGAAAAWLHAIAYKSSWPSPTQWPALNSRLALDVAMTLRRCLDKSDPELQGDAIMIAARAMGRLATTLSDFLLDDPATPVQPFHATLLQAHWNSPIARADARALETKLCVSPQCMDSTEQRRAAFGRLARVVCAAALVADEQVGEEIVAFVDTHLVPYFILESSEEATQRLTEFNTAVLIRALADGHTILPFLASNLSYFKEFTSCKPPPRPLPADYVCAVCLDADDGRRALIFTQCGHIFHCVCLARTAATVIFNDEITAHHACCPCCRTNLVSANRSGGEI